MRPGYVYILTNRPRGVLYVGVTADPITRVWLHRKCLDPRSFTSRYNVSRLVYLDVAPNIVDAIRREKQLKRWRRDWKLALVEATNPDWVDLIG